MSLLCFLAGKTGPFFPGGPALMNRHAEPDCIQRVCFYRLCPGISVGDKRCSLQDTFRVQVKKVQDYNCLTSNYCALGKVRSSNLGRLQSISRPKRMDAPREQSAFTLFVLANNARAVVRWKITAGRLYWLRYWLDYVCHLAKCRHRMRITNVLM